MSDCLMHYGVKGMKWGVRKSRYNENYSEDQRKRDKGVYGRTGVRRINKRMNSGMNISAARSKEAGRIHSTRRRAVFAGQAGSMVGGIGGAIAGYHFSNKILSKYGSGDPTTDMAIRMAASGGVGSIGRLLGRYGGQSLGMLSGGYSPSKFRYG